MMPTNQHTPALKMRTMAAALCCSAFASPVVAQETPVGFSVGLGVAAGNGIFVGEDKKATAFPILRYDSDAFSIGLPDGARVTLFDQGSFRISGIVTPRLSAIDSSDSADLDGFDRELTAGGGIQLRYNIAQQTRLSLRAVTELTDEHEGSEVDLSVSQALPIGNFPLRVTAGAKWQSEELAAYTYGVSAADAAASSFAQYDPGKIIITHISIGTAIPINDRARVLANVRAEFLPDEVSNSPIMDEKVSIGALIGISYSF